MTVRRRLGAFLILVALIAVGIGIYQRIRWERTIAPVRTAISVLPADKPAYPGARTPTEKMLARRSADGFDEGLERSLNRLRGLFEKDASHSPTVAYWLGAGLTVSGNLKTARAVVDIARVHHSRDQTLWILDAILTLEEGDLALARERLETLLELFPDTDLARENLDRLPSS